jgi:hypothetical protein
VDYERKCRLVEGKGYQTSIKNSSGAERTSQVDAYFNQPNGPPSVVPNTSPSSTDICHLLLLLFCIFGTLFSTVLNGGKAGNRFDALALQFLDRV